MFSHWVEAGVIWDRHPATIASWFHTNIITRFGTPEFVYSDHGTEFRGVFRSYLCRLGINYVLILPQHPRANGLMERVNGILLQGIKHLLKKEPDKDVEGTLPDMLAGLHFLPHKLGHQPFVTVFK